MSTSLKRLSTDNLIVKLKLMVKIDEESLQSLKDNDIDGEMLLELVNDVDEFSKVLPESGCRLRIKSAIRSLEQETDSLGLDELTPSPVLRLPDVDSLLSSVEGNDGDSSLGNDVSNYSPQGSGASLDDGETPHGPPAPKRAKTADIITDQHQIKSLESIESSMSFDINNIILPSSSRYPSAIQKAIEGNDLSEPSIRYAFIRESVNFFEKILPRPTHEQYLAISKAFCGQYPSLKCSGTAYWETFNKQFTQRYRNIRRPMRKDGQGPTAVQHVLPMVAQVRNTEDRDVETEEYKENVETLRNIFNKNPPTQAVTDLLEATRGPRITWLNKEDISLQAIFEIYPCLKISKWLLHEFSQIIEDILPTMITRWLKTCNHLTLNHDSEVSFQNHIN